MSAIKPILLGCSGQRLSRQEKALFGKMNPFGFILFQRNCQDRDQLRNLTKALREAVGRDDVPIFIDQEGGRVARLKPPEWPALPPLKRIGEIYEKDRALGRMAMYLHALMTSRLLHEVGINGNCAPVLDLYIPGACEAIGDRALSSNPQVVEACGKVAIQTFLKNGILPVIKHMPGHGRVKVDPHKELPFVDAALDVLETQDFLPFMGLKDAPIAMNCHVVFCALDPDQPVSLSSKVHREWIRGRIGYEGLLFSDDLAMGALQGDLRSRASKALGAGADIILYCTGDLGEMEEICADLPDITPEAWARWERARDMAIIISRTITLESIKSRLDKIISVMA